MKEFLKFTAATIVGIVFVCMLGIFLMVGFTVAIVALNGDKKVSLKPHSVYELYLEGKLVDRSEDDFIRTAFGKFTGNSSEYSVGLDDVLANIEKAKNDTNVVGIYLHGGTMSAGFASVKEIRDALSTFKKSGKFIVAYSDNYTQKMYYLVSVADKILINPVGMLEFKGIVAENMFFKNTLDKLGIEMQTIRVGAFKSAVEPYTRTNMSDENRKQITAYTNSIWSTLLSEVSATRKISTEKLREYSDEMLMFQPTERAKKYGLVDSLVYIDEVDSILCTTVKINAKKEKLNFVGHYEMTKVVHKKNHKKNKIAILYGIGEITDDEGEEEGIVATNFINTIDKLRKDSSVKAVVLRINSPGGGAHASEQIWRALSLLQSKKPLIVSMGDYAASGGYHIASVANKIVAQPNTITGSIGIFGIIPNMKGLYEKIGVSFDKVKTNETSDAISTNRPLTIEERNVMQHYLNRGYELFVKQCADGRKMSLQAMTALADGRVWTGRDAKELGLVDNLGGLSDAVRMAATIAKLGSYSIKEYPEKENFENILIKMISQRFGGVSLKNYLGEQYDVWEHINRAKKMNGLQARLPYTSIIH